ncbi:zinc metalloprotease [Parvularcula lutaonensis]|uniref:Peptidase M10 metallopeptidase domain-containing protein n=1 Tax=Parvularcula lutaonensis TaxID=491923 RepID=A0ABV7MDA4_9PROT|nr:hypothetical protein [Parvularcula lutaonensis]GGY52070.1 hypothetical protein GCM10007148_21380 [Parvularcula lutaonensis]
MNKKILALSASLAAGAAAWGGLASASDADAIRGLTGESAIQAFRAGDFALADDHEMFCGVKKDPRQKAVDRVMAIIEAESGISVNDASDPNFSGYRSDFSEDAVQARVNSDVTIRRRTADPVIFLDFDRDAGQLPTFEVDLLDVDGSLVTTFVLPDYVYMADDRAFILDRVRADLEPYGFIVTDVEPASGPYTEIDFANNDRVPGQGTNVTLTFTPSGAVSFSILFGRADEIDFGNDNYDSGAFTDASLWTVVSELFTVGTFEAFSGIVPADSDGDGEVDFAALQFAVRNQSANTGAHEIGHTLGLRHHDSIGPIDQGLPTTGRPAPGAFLPAYTGPIEATETPFNLMASGASVGLPLQNATTVDRSFSQRSNLKLQLAQTRAKLVSEAQLINELADPNEIPRFFEPKRSILRPLTMRPGKPDRYLDSYWFQGTIDGPQGFDTYAFKGKAGQTITAEIISQSDSNIFDFALTRLDLLRVDPLAGFVPVATNINTFEPFDPLLFDFTFQETGNYVLVVTAPDEFYFDIDGDGVVPDSLVAVGAESLLEGDYDLLMYFAPSPRRFQTVMPMAAAVQLFIGDESS